MGIETLADEDTPRGEPRQSLAIAYNELEKALEFVDFEEDSEVADEVISAIAAIDRAYSIYTTD